MTSTAIDSNWTEKKWILWHSADQLPDADETVLLHMPEAESEQVWPGYWDGEQWLLADGMPASKVEAWTQMPEGPA